MSWDAIPVDMRALLHERGPIEPFVNSDDSTASSGHPGCGTGMLNGSVPLLGFHGDPLLRALSSFEAFHGVLWSVLEC